VLIFIYAFLGIAATAVGGVCFGLDKELWIGLLAIGVGFVFMVLAIYYLDKKYGFISNPIRNRKKEKVEKISNGNYEMKPLRMVSMMIRAYEDRRTLGSLYVLEKAIENITSSYKALLKNWKFVARESDKLDSVGEDGVEKILFDAFESLVIMLINADENLELDYDIYCAFCARTSHTPRTKEEVRTLAAALFENNGAKAVEKTKLFKEVGRACMPHKKYFDLVQGFCHLALSDNIVDEGEYVVISMTLFKKGFDTIPDTWEDFKKEYR
jgi:hypothetical protein